VASLALALALSVLWLGSSARAQSSLDCVPGEILVKWATGQTILAAASAHDQVAGLTLREFSHIGWEHLQIDPTIDVQTAVQKMLQQPGVIAAEPNYIVHLSTTVPNDTSFGLQWALQNTGQTVNGTAGSPGADISATAAWDLRTTAPNIVVAVIDSGITLNHADLRSNLWVNPGEIPGNGIDDDGNGKIDDVNGWDFVNNDNRPTDDTASLHGTHVAGIIGAKGNDGSGIAGVSWTVQLMILKFLDSSGSGTTANAISAILYATAEGAHVINASWGSSSFSQALKDAIDSFPGIFVAAAGNTGTNNDVSPLYPACYTSANIITVAATDQNDTLASFSNFGTTCVDLAAPGVNILSDNAVGLFQFLLTSP
jgi:subtilisin family serine protease